MKNKKHNNTTIYANNRKAYYNYHIIEEFEAGIILTGPEVKSIRNGLISIKESYITVDSNKLVLLKAHITKPGYIDAFTKFDTDRERTLLLNKSEVNKIKKTSMLPGYTIMVLSVYQPANSRNIKLQIAVCKGKVNHDKREALKQKSQERDIKQALKQMF